MLSNNTIQILETITEINLTHLTKKDVIDNDINQFRLPLQKQEYKKLLML